MSAIGSSLPRPPTGALRPPVAIGPSDIDEGADRRGPIPAPSSALSLPSAEVLRPPVAMGPSDMDDGEHFHRGLADRNLSMSDRTSFRTEGSGYNPWITPPARMASSEEADGVRRMGAPGYIGESMAVSGGWGIAETGFDPASVNFPAQARRSRDSPPRPPRPPDGFVDAAAKQAVGFNPTVVSIQLPAESERNAGQQNFVSGGAVASSAPAGTYTFGSVGAKEWSTGGMGNLNAGVARPSGGSSMAPARPFGGSSMAPARPSGGSSMAPAAGKSMSPGQLAAAALAPSQLQQAPLMIDRPQPFSALPRTNSRSAPQAGEGQGLLYREQQFRADQDERRRGHALLQAEEWVAKSRPFEVSRTPVITYPGGASVKFQDHAYSFMHVAIANANDRRRVIESMEMGEFPRAAMEIYKACDRQMNGFLSWNDGEIADFIITIFQKYGLTPPTESQIFQIYANFDFDRSMFLGARECICLADALFRAVFLFEANSIPRATSNLGTPGPYNLSRAPSSGPTAATFILTPPPSDGNVVAYNPGGHPPPPPSWQWPHMANPQDVEPQMYGMPTPEVERKVGAGEWPVSDWSWGEIGSLFGFKSGGPQKQAPAPAPMAPAPPPVDEFFGQVAEVPARPYQVYRAPPQGGGEGFRQEQPFAPAANPWPEEAWSWKGLGSLFASQKGAQRRDQLPGPPVATYEAYGAPPLDPPPPPQPSYKKASIDPALMWADPNSIGNRPMPEAPPSMMSRPPPPPAPEVPKWRAEVETRKHILEVDLEEVRISFHSPDMAPAWYQSSSYYVSFRPTSEPPDNISLPLEAPLRTEEGKHLVSKSQTAKKPPVDNGHPLSAVFKEKMKLTTEWLDQSLGVFVWGKKAGLLAEAELVLVGMCVVPLFDFKVQRKVIPWKIMDPTVDKPIGELLMRHEVMTSPGPVQLPLLSEVKKSEVSISWTPPLNDHGSPIIGYKISILIAPKLEGGLLSKLAKQGAETGPQWVTLDECTKALTPAYVIKELQGNTSYMVNIQAVNVVGPGDDCEFQIQTSPVEPSCPKKPWIQEARDGCLCVAWHAPDDDGGSAVTAYRVQMMKKVGSGPASGLMAVFGQAAGGGDAAWVNMGTVGAVMDEVKDQPSVYTVWAGPLDTQKCEYRFRVYAINSAGVSAKSECTDPHYT